jgi:hypothetical protein
MAHFADKVLDCISYLCFVMFNWRFIFLYFICCLSICRLFQSGLYIISLPFVSIVSPQSYTSVSNCYTLLQSLFSGPIYFDLVCSGVFGRRIMCPHKLVFTFATFFISFNLIYVFYFIHTVFTVLAVGLWLERDLRRGSLYFVTPTFVIY